MSRKTRRKINKWYTLSVFCVIAVGFAAITLRGGEAKEETNAINISVLQTQMKEIQGSDLPAQVAALRDRMTKVESGVENSNKSAGEANKKLDDLNGYAKLFVLGVLFLVGQRAWTVLYPSKGGTESGDTWPTIGGPRG